MIEITNLKKSYHQKTVLDSLTFSIKTGEVYGLLGPNGAGKTTTINILCGLLGADDGNVLVNNEPVSENTKSQMGIVPQENAVYRDLTCRENLMFFTRLYGLQGAERIKKTDRLIQEFKLNKYADTEVSKLSGGWQRRINIAIALVHSPSVLILDEPTTGLDVEARYELWELIDNLKDANVTILLTSHQLEEVERLCSRIGIIKDGHIKAEGSFSDLRKRIPAKQLAEIETNDKKIVIDKVHTLGWTYRYYGGRLTLWLPDKFTLKSIVNKFDNIPLTSVSLKEVSLEHIYIEVTGN